MPHTRKSSRTTATRRAKPAYTESLVPDAQTFHDIVSGRRRGAGGFLARTLLGAAEIPYRAAIGVRNRRFDNAHAKIHRASVPVISVGNLTLGGTGKTPTVAWLAHWFRERNIRVSIISRGYRSEADGQNDEARELEQQLPDVPHLQNPDRVAAMHVAVEELETQVILLDDGFQHRRLARDLDIVLLDATEPFGHGRVFPRGLLREPITSLSRAQCIALSRADMVSDGRVAAIRTQVKRYAPHATWLELAHRPDRLLACSGKSAHLTVLSDKRVAAFCGIGNPQGFRHTLESCGYDVVQLRTFPDHHKYTADDVAELQCWIKGSQRGGLPADDRADAVVCTNKDLVKLSVDQLAGVPVWAVTVDIEIRSGMEAFTRQLDSICQRIEESQ